MRTILFECPFTGAAISTGIETDPISFCRLSKKWLSLYCPACRKFHGAKIWLDQESSAHQFMPRELSGAKQHRPEQLRDNINKLLAAHKAGTQGLRAPKRPAANQRAESAPFVRQENTG